MSSVLAVQPSVLQTQGHQEHKDWRLVGSSGSQSPGEPSTLAGNYCREQACPRNLRRNLALKILPYLLSYYPDKRMITWKPDRSGWRIA
jgi:hypothetical protein